MSLQCDLVINTLISRKFWKKENGGEGKFWYFSHCFCLSSETYSCMNKSKLLVWFSRTSQFLLLHSLIACFFFLKFWACLHDIEKLSPTIKKKGAILANIWGISSSIPKNVDRVLNLFANTFMGYFHTWILLQFFKNHKKILVSKLLCYLHTYYGVEKFYTLIWEIFRVINLQVDFTEFFKKKII